MASLNQYIQLGFSAAKLTYYHRAACQARRTARTIVSLFEISQQQVFIVVQQRVDKGPEQLAIAVGESAGPNGVDECV